MEYLDESMRRKAVTFALRMSADTPLAADAYEHTLLEAYVQGRLSLEQLLDLANQHRRIDLTAPPGAPS